MTPAAMRRMILNSLGPTDPGELRRHATRAQRDFFMKWGRDIDDQGEAVVVDSRITLFQGRG